MKNLSKILVVSSFFYPHVGGSQQYMEDLYITLLKKHPEIQIDILCCNTDSVSTKEKYNGFIIYRLPCWNIITGKFAIPDPIALWRFFNSHPDYDLIHASTRFFDLSWWALLWGKVMRKKVILTDHCAGTPRSSNPLVNLPAILIDTVSGKILLKLYDKVFAVSNATKVFLSNKFRVNSTVLYGGPSSIFLNQLKGNKSSKISLVYAGRMIPEKGVNDLFDIASTMDQIEFFFAGPGDLVKKLRKQIKQKNLSNIHILGKVNKKELAKLFRQSDIFVYPSYHPEGIPMAILEAGASKLAVIATNTGGIKEIIKNNQTGLLIKPGDNKSLKDAIEKLINSRTLRNNLSQNLFAHIKKKFNWEKTTDRLYLEIQKLH